MGLLRRSSGGLLARLAAAFAGGPLGNGRLASVGPSGFQVGLVAILELGITAAHPRPRRTGSYCVPGAGGVWGERVPPRIGGLRGDQGFAPPDQMPPGQHDETDDAHGHRIYVNPWAADE